MRRFSPVLAVAALLPSATVRADAQEDHWQFAVTPYVYLPHLDASMRYETPGSGGSEVSMENLLKHLHAALFLNGEARKGMWGLAADFVYCSFQKESSNVSTVTGPGGAVETPINRGTTSSLSGYMGSLTANYALLRTPNAKLDLLAGFRYTHIGATLDWSFATAVADLPQRTGSAERGVDLWDGIVGARGSARLGDGKWFVPYYIDVGTGTSTFTWQAMAGIGYSFGWGDMLLVYRHISFEQGDGRPVQHLYFSGPALGATFRF
ncbi:MAG TPA: hypothetical protein VMT66_01695 [Steroidobacteraceae bacterium]|nr:hypothetical protein [Steroidobacteraceae bacterium]